MKNRKGHLFKRGKTYFVRWMVDGKVFVRTTGETNEKNAVKRQAEIMAPFEARTTRKILEGIAEQIAEADSALDSSKPPLAIADAWKAYLKASNRPQSGPRTLEGYEGHFRRFSDWVKTNYPATLELRDVTRTIADEYGQDLIAAKLKPSSYNQHIKLLDLVWSVLREPGRISLNPWAWDKKNRSGMARMKIDKAAGRHKPLEPEQVNELIEIAEGDFKDLLTLLAFTGQRLFDCVYLRWESVKDAAKILEVVQRKMARRGNGEPVQIPILPPVAAVLENRKRAGAFVFPELVELYSRDNGSTLSKRIGAIMENAGLNRTREGEDGARGVAEYGAHSFRHAFVTNARAFGIPDGLIAKITGHKTDAMLDHYTAFSKKLVSALAKKANRIKNVTPEPVAALPSGVDFARLRGLVEKMNSKNWKKTKAELLKVIL